MFNTRIITCALAGVLFIGSQAIAQGGPEVTVVNTPLPVTVTNPTPPPSAVNVGNPAALAAANAQAIAPALGVGTPVAFVLEPGPFTYSVPVGQRLVIEYVSGFCPQGFGLGSHGVPIRVTTNGATQSHIFAVSNQTVSFGHLVRIYADPGSNVQNITPADGGCTFLVSGQLVNTP